MHIPRLIARAAATACTTTSTPTATPTKTLPPSSTGLDYSIPSSWALANVSHTYDYMNHIAQEAIDVMRTSYWKDPAKVDFGWGTGTTLSALAYKDMVASTKTNKDTVKKILAAAKKNNQHFDPYCYNDDAMWWGTTAMYAYRAYGDKEFLGWAKDVWNWVLPAQITPEQAKAGKTPIRPDGTFKSTCDGKTTAGGVFWRSQCGPKGDMGTNVITTALFQTLSAYLAEATGEKKYTTAAQRAFTYITDHLILKDKAIPGDGLGLGSCKKNNWVFTYNTGKFVEGAIILSHITKDAKYKSAALAAIIDGVKHTKNWQNEKGEIKEGQDGDPKKGNDGRQFKVFTFFRAGGGGERGAIYIRALTEVARREYQNKELRALLKAYINIQYNNLITKDTDKKGNYGVVWKGPYEGPYQSGQANALDLLVAGIEFNWKR
ncbi:Six-hairpin glycosidase [Exidia glandulosa HHB12029]|uniref:Six-hairpin glycosidase n=1 Tax=Exidia glandulosa HHB12029 TaxID=1314781 RepID=A0A165LUU0_EXIGL|nr:Six-hairpin glycosidase [Exidia glandulosa HHB12029]